MPADTFAYLLLALWFLPFWGVCWYLRPDLRSLMLRASLQGAIAGPLSEAWYFRDYWSPPTIVGTGMYSPEDVIFGFGVMGVAVAIYALVARKKMVKDKPAHRRWFAPMAISLIFAFLILTDLLHVNSIFTSIIILTVWTLVMLIIRRDLFIPAIASSLLLTAIMLLSYLLLFDVLFPRFVEQYWFLWGGPFGAMVLGNIPVTEILWYLAIGAFAGTAPHFLRGTSLGRHRYYPVFPAYD